MSRLGKSLGQVLRLNRQGGTKVDQRYFRLRPGFVKESAKNSRPVANNQDFARFLRQTLLEKIEDA